MAIVTVPVAKLVEDQAIYPRAHLDTSNVAEIRRAYEAKTKIPPPIVDGKFRIIDGWHRVNAWRRLHGNTAKIKVDQRHFKSEADAVAAAVAENIGRGQNLNKKDQTRSVLLLEEQGLAPAQIAVVLHTTEKRVTELSVRVVLVNGDPHPAPRAYQPRKTEQPQEMTSAQFSVARSSGGWRHTQTLNQLRNEIDNDLFDTDDEKLVRAAHALLGSLAKWCKAHPA